MPRARRSHILSVVDYHQEGANAMKGTGGAYGADWRMSAACYGAGLTGRPRSPGRAGAGAVAPPADARSRAATRVLIVDDGASAREGLCALLATFPDIEVIAAVHDGPAALDLVDTLHPDVVVLDARLPLLDGLAATRLVKARAGNVRVIVLSFCSAYRDAAREAGADAFLVKGGPVEELVRAIRQL
jgi:CheY-like chemotaxis protein